MSLFAFLHENRRFLFAGAVLSFLSSFGQTYFIAIFSAEIMGTFDLSDGQWGGLYTVSTTASALVMLWAGALTDRFRVRQLIWTVLPVLALTCLAMAANSAVPLLFLVIFFLRLFGQGMTMQLSVVAMARWFAARRGLALSLAALGFAVGQAGLPVIVALGLTVFDWRSMWVGAALILALSVPLLHWLLTKERTPQSHAEDKQSVGMDGRHWTRGEVLRSPIFWLLLPMLLGPPAWGTALFFQQVHIAAVKGWPLVDYLALIPLLTVVGIAATLVSGQLIDRFGSAALARFYMLPFAATFFLIGSAETLGVAAIGMIFFGIGHGIQSTVPAAFWSEYFGTRHIGAIKAVSTSIMVFGSAIGPGISGALIDLGYSFPEQMGVLVVYFLIAAILVWVATARAKRSLAPA
ncbi:MFS transporter [Alphaproteobacteria bacterium GH1-50]|uniref:MFS transporter n=1 Tax=Kangsaoukella pontilimi TaxID=2691042 RepID=A0A7C9MRE5_9RHOB|nr:MFS transporter [Kangsaoukella pontilimi]MXQ08237.1 MFS transporter [Kangsaoukella pontilimi]